MRPFSLTDEAFSVLVEEVGWLAPYYLEKAAGLVRPTGGLDADGRPFARPDDVRGAVNTMLSAENRTYFVTWEEHIRKNFSKPTATGLQSILAVVCRRPEGEQFNTIEAAAGSQPTPARRAALRDHLNVLLADGYLESATEGETVRYRFRSGLLRRYWRRYIAP
jgi:hypothetical protein